MVTPDIPIFPELILDREAESFFIYAFKNSILTLAILSIVCVCENELRFVSDFAPNGLFTSVIP